MIKESDINITIEKLDREMCRYRGCRLSPDLVNRLISYFNIAIYNIKACELTPEKEFNDKIDNVIKALVDLKKENV